LMVPGATGKRPRQDCDLVPSAPQRGGEAGRLNTRAAELRWIELAHEHDSRLPVPTVLRRSVRNHGSGRNSERLERSRRAQDGPTQPAQEVQDRFGRPGDEPGDPVTAGAATQLPGLAQQGARTPHVPRAERNRRDVPQVRGPQVAQLSGAEQECRVAFCREFLEDPRPRGESLLEIPERALRVNTITGQWPVEKAKWVDTAEPQPQVVVLRDVQGLIESPDGIKAFAPGHHGRRDDKVLSHQPPEDAARMCETLCREHHRDETTPIGVPTVRRHQANRRIRLERRHLGTHHLDVPDVVGVEEGDETAARLPYPTIPGRSRAPVGLADDADHLAKGSRKRGSRVRRAIVHDHDFEVFECLIEGGLQRVAEEGNSIVCRNDYGHPGNVRGNRFRGRGASSQGSPQLIATPVGTGGAT